jgi:hypothetical protein
VLYYGRKQSYSYTLERLAKDNHSKIDFLFYNNTVAKQARVLVPGKPFQHGLIFSGKDRSLPYRGVTEMSFTRVGYNQTLICSKGLKRTITPT